MGVYDPDMRVMYSTRIPGLFASHAEYKTRLGADNFAAKLKKRKPKVHYDVALVGSVYKVIVQK